MKKLLILGVVAVTGAFASSAFAAQPANPGCFGQDRSTNVQAGTGKAWGDLASDRGGTNGELNQDWKITCGGSPA